MLGIKNAKILNILVQKGNGSLAKATTKYGMVVAYAGHLMVKDLSSDSISTYLPGIKKPT